VIFKSRVFRCCGVSMAQLGRNWNKYAPAVDQTPPTWPLGGGFKV